MHFIEENCGVFGICSQYDCSGEIFQAIDFLQHRGQQYCGMSTYDGTIHHETHRGRVANSFPDDELARLKGRWGIGHVSLRDRQPLRWRTRLGEISVGFSGNVINAHELASEMMGRGKSFLEGTDVEIISKIIIEGASLTDGIADLARKIRGAYSLVVLSKDGVYAARDVYGFRPLILGQDALGNRHAVASESRALENLDMEIYRDVTPGEIVLINDDGIRTLARLPSPRIAHCAFEWAYTASMDSIIDGVYVQEARDNLGESLAQRDLEEGTLSADIVAPVPMSGIGHALGYHKRSRINYQEVFLYNRYADRSYTQATQQDREKMAKRKLSILPYVKGKRIILCDDSIVRGTQIRYKVADLKAAGAREVHVRVACPPLMYPCDFGISTRSYGELLARSYIRAGDIISLEQQRALETWVAGRVGADSVRFNTIDDFVASLMTERGKLCLACFDGVAPYSANI